METLVHFRLTEYNDIFSDFDPRSLDVRGLSRDFLKELRKATSEVGKGEAFEVVFYLPPALRQHDQEKVIVERLHGHFHKHARRLNAEQKVAMRKGAIFLMAGFGLMIVSTFSLFSAFRVVFEPAGWFIGWYGADRLFSASGKKEAWRRFYRMMQRGQLRFASESQKA